MGCSLSEAGGYFGRRIAATQTHEIPVGRLKQDACSIVWSFKKQCRPNLMAKHSMPSPEVFASCVSISERLFCALVIASSPEVNCTASKADSYSSNRLEIFSSISLSLSLSELGAGFTRGAVRHRFGLPREEAIGVSVGGNSPPMSSGDFPPLRCYPQTSCVHERN